MAGAAVHREVRVRLGAGTGQSDQLVAAIDPRRGRAALRVRREHGLERAPQLGRGPRTVLGLERQRRDQNALQVVGRVTARMRLAQRRERLLGQGVGQQLVQRGAESEHVEAGIRLDEAGLQRQVARGAQRLAHAGRPGSHRPGREPINFGDPDDPEVDQFHVQAIVGVGEHDVRRLHVAVDQALAVGGVQGVGDLDPDLQHLPPRQRTGPGQVLAEVRALDQLEDGVQVLPVAVVGQDPHDRGVIHAGEHHGLLGEAAPEVRVPRAQQLDRHVPMELPVACSHDHCPAADPNAVQEVKTTPETLFWPIALVLAAHAHLRGV